VKHTAIYPGTFDPITYGHLDIITRGLTIFDRMIVAVVGKSHKNALFSAAERVEMAREATAHLKKVEVQVFDSLLVDFVSSLGGKILIRGLRAVSDFEYELQLALMNRVLDKDIETVFLMPSDQYIYLSSRIVKEVACYGGDVSSFVLPQVAARMERKFGTGSGRRTPKKRRKA
jgi:pantetheine-phosphate adenylyltransferase